MPLFSEHISNMYYSGTPSYSSPYSSYTRSPSPLGTSYSATYLNPGGNYSTHSSLGSYSRAPLTSRWISGLSRNYSPMLTPISERGTSSPVRINSPRRIPLSKRSYGTSGYTQRPININTADIDVSRDKYRRKSIDKPIAAPKPPPYKEPTKEAKEKCPFMPRVDGKPETGIDSSPGPQRNTIKRGRTVVRLHTIKRKERDSPRKAETVEPQDDKQNDDVSETETNESKSWREKLSEDLAYTEKKEKKTLGAKFVETFIVKDVSDQENKTVNNLGTEHSSENCDPTSLQTNDEYRPFTKSPDRRCSMELLAEQASVLDSLIRSENLSTATLDLSKVGVAEEPKANAETIKKKKCNTKENPLNKTKSDQSLHENLKSQTKSKDSNLFSKRRSLKKSSSGGSICRLDSITELPKDSSVLTDLPAIEENRKSIERDKTNIKPKPKLKAKITTSVEISPPSSPLKFRIENVTVEEKINLPKKEIIFTSAVEETTTHDVTIQSPLRRTKERHSIRRKNKKVDDPISPEPDDGNFWNKIGKRETVYLIKRKQNLDEMKEKNKRALFWYPEDEDSVVTEAAENIDESNSEVANDAITSSNLNSAVTTSNLIQKKIIINDTNETNIKLEVSTLEKSNTATENSSKEVDSENLQAKLDQGQSAQNILEHNNIITKTKEPLVSIKTVESNTDLKKKQIKFTSQPVMKKECRDKTEDINNELNDIPLEVSEIIKITNISEVLAKTDKPEDKLELPKIIETKVDVIRNQDVSNDKQIATEIPKIDTSMPIQRCENEITTKISTKGTEEVTTLNSTLPLNDGLSLLLNTEIKTEENDTNTKNISGDKLVEKFNEASAPAETNEYNGQNIAVETNQKPKESSLKCIEKKFEISTKAKSQEKSKNETNKINSSEKQNESKVSFAKAEIKISENKIETKIKAPANVPIKHNIATKLESKISNNIIALKTDDAGPAAKLKDNKAVDKYPINSVEHKTDINTSITAKNTSAATTNVLQSNTSTEVNDKSLKLEETVVKNCEEPKMPAINMNKSAIASDNNTEVPQVPEVIKSENIPTIEAKSETSQVQTEVDTEKNTREARADMKHEKEQNENIKQTLIKTDASIPTIEAKSETSQVQTEVDTEKNTREVKADMKPEKEQNESIKQTSIKTDAPLIKSAPKKPVKEEKAIKPLIATPRPLQKRAPQVINSSESSDSSSDETSDEEEESDTSEGSTEFFECENNADGRTSTGSNDSGFDSSAPTSPASFMQIKKDCDVNCHRKCEKLTANLCGVNQRLLVEALATRTSSKKGADSPGPSSSNATSQLPATDILEQELEQSTAYGLFRKTGRFTPPARSIPRFRKYTIEDFQFIKVLGKGSFGKVLLAELRDTEYYYAVKCLKKDVVLEDDDVECTLIERKVLALGTNHPYLCHLFATFQTDSHLFFVMEYLNGGDLMFHIQQSGRFPEARARFYGAEIVSGLKFLHKRGIVYRDLKLDNILLDFDGHVRIADFGMCKLQIYLEKTADTFCGTPDYMAPEIIKGLKYNQTVDWWSFGVLLYEMLIGQSPFSGCDEDELFWSICNEMPSYPRFLSQESLTILTRLLDKDARSRLGGVECMHGDIREQDFFHQIHWDRLERRELDAPFRPRVRHPLDTQYFDRAFTGERPRLTAVEPHVLRSMDQEPFRGFSYTNPNATDR